MIQQNANKIIIIIEFQIISHLNYYLVKFLARHYN